MTTDTIFTIAALLVTIAAALVNFWAYRKKPHTHRRVIYLFASMVNAALAGLYFFILFDAGYWIVFVENFYFRTLVILLAVSSALHAVVDL